MLHGSKRQGDLPKVNGTLHTNGIGPETTTSIKKREKKPAEGWANQLDQDQHVIFKTPLEKTCRKVKVIEYLSHTSCKMKTEDGTHYW